MYKFWIDKTLENITSCDQFLWESFGDKYVFTISAWKPGKNGYSSSMVFNILTQEVYEISLFIDDDDDGEHEYRWIDKKYRKAVKKEYKRRGLRFDGDTFVVQHMSKKQIKKMIKGL